MTITELAAALSALASNAGCSVQYNGHDSWCFELRTFRSACAHEIVEAALEALRADGEIFVRFTHEAIIVRAA